MKIIKGKNVEWSVKAWKEKSINSATRLNNIAFRCRLKVGNKSAFLSSLGCEARCHHQEGSAEILLTPRVSEWVGIQGMPSLEAFKGRASSYGTRKSFKYPIPRPFPVLMTSTLNDAWKQVGSQLFEPKCDVLLPQTTLWLLHSGPTSASSLSSEAAPYRKETLQQSNLEMTRA